MAYLTEASKSALTAAVASIERGSAAEVVIAVRAHSGSMLAADLIGGVVGGLATLAFLLFSAVPFSLPAIFFDTFVFGALGAFVCSRSPSLRRWLIPNRAHNVRVAARAEFFDAAISHTRGRTGILVYVSQTEQAAEVLADCGVRDAIDDEVWNAWVMRVQREVQQERDGVVLAAVIGEIAGPLAACLPRAHDDVNELADHVR